MKGIGKEIFETTLQNKANKPCDNAIYSHLCEPTGSIFLPEQDKLKEECAVFGVSLNFDEAAGTVYNGLLALQHRGQEGAGIAVVDTKSPRIMLYKNLGLVTEIFTTRLNRFPAGRVAVGHTRYSNAGCASRDDAGPFLAEFLTGRICVSHNGSILNAAKLKKQLEKEGVLMASNCDGDVVASLIAFCIKQTGDVLPGVLKALKQLEGAYSLCIATANGDLIAARDPKGFRPLCLGAGDAGYAVASESCALDSAGFEFLRSVAPGELVVIPKDSKGKIQSHKIDSDTTNKTGGLCIFEYVYFARPDSVIDGLSVYEARHNMGRALAEEFPIVADIVCGVPDSGLEAAQGYSAESGIPLSTAFVKNRYIGRSFIYPTQKQREGAVKIKLNPLRSAIEGKRVILVDDSIVRGTTSAKIIQNLKNAGAKEVHMLISSPPFKHTCNYGTDIDSEDKLIANQMSLDEICQKIGADSLGYISLEGLKRSCMKNGINHCVACFKNK